MNVEAGSPQRASNETDALVIGGRSSAAIAPADLGHRVTLLAEAHHPRFRVGEPLLPADLPLLPASLPLLERLGVAAQCGVRVLEPAETAG